MFEKKALLGMVSAIVAVVIVIASIPLSSQLTPKEYISEIESNAAASVQSPNDDPSKIDGAEPVNDMAIEEPQQLTDEEKSRIRTIIEQDQYLAKTLKKTNWRVADISTWSKDPSEKIGGAALVLLEKSVWFDDSYYNIFTKGTQKVKIWTSSMNVFVDLRENKVAGLDVGISRPGDTLPADADQPQAKKVAHDKAKEEFGNNVETTLLGTYYSIPEHKKGLSVFLVTQDQQEKMLVAVDLDSMSVDEKRTSKMAGVE